MDPYVRRWRQDLPAVWLGLAVSSALLLAALAPAARLVVLACLALVALLAPAGGRLRWAAVAGPPVTLILVWGSFAPRAPGDVSDCADPFALPAVLRVAEATLVLAAVALLARWLGVTASSIGLRRPSRSEVALGMLAVVMVAVPSLLLGALLARPFFGPIRLDLAEPLALIPAVALAIANGTMEEVAYRGALMAWLGHASVPMVALVGQAVVFGAAHTGSDYVGEAWPVVMAVAAGGLLAGIVVRTTGSLWLPIAVHIGFDVPLYFAAACRLPAD